MKEYVSKHLYPFCLEHNKNFKLKVFSEGFYFLYDDDNLNWKIGFRHFLNLVESNGNGITVRNVEQEMSIFLQSIGFHLDKPYETLISIPQDEVESVRLKRVSIGSVEINCEDDFIKVANLIKKYLSEITFPYLNKYSNIEGISEALNTMSMSEILVYIGGDFPIQFYKAMYITYHARNFGKYEEIKKEFPIWIEIAKHEGENYAAKLPLYEKGFSELINKLER